MNNTTAPTQMNHPYACSLARCLVLTLLFGGSRLHETREFQGREYYLLEKPHPQRRRHICYQWVDDQGRTLYENRWYYRRSIASARFGEWWADAMGVKSAVIVETPSGYDQLLHEDLRRLRTEYETCANEVDKLAATIVQAIPLGGMELSQEDCLSKQISVLREFIKGRTL